MTEEYRPWSPQEIEQKMQRLSERLEDAVGTFYSIAGDHGTAKADYEIAYAKAMLTARLAVDEDDKKLYSSAADREAAALTDCAELYRKHQIAAALHDAQRRLLEVLRVDGELLRTLLVQSRGVQDPRR
jgi:hypothetical protein